jgi:O-antigen/teichoic acid export membrane protein
MKNLKDFMVLSVGHVFQALILIFSTRLMTALLSPLEIGRFSLLYAVIALFTALFLSCVGTYIQRRIVEWNRQGLIPKYFCVYVIYLLCSTIFVGVVVLVGKYIGWFTLAVDPIWILIIIFGLLVIASINTFFYTSLNFFGKRVAFITCSNLTFFFNLIFSVILISAFQCTAEFWILGQILGQGLMMLIGGALFFHIINRSPSGHLGDHQAKPILPEMFHFVWPISVASLIMWVQSQSYRFVIQDLHSLEIVGFVAVGYNLGVRLTEKVESLLLTFYEPIFYHQLAHSTKEERVAAWDQYAGFVFPTMLMVSGFICFGWYFLARIFFAPSFQDISGPMIIWGGLTTLVLAINAVYTKVGVADLKMTGLIVPYLLGAIVTLSLLFIFSPTEPFWGTGFSLFAGSLVLFLCLMYKMHRLLPVHFPFFRFGRAVFYLMPLWMMFIFFRRIFSDPSTVVSIGVLMVAGLYVVFIELILNKEWLEKSDYKIIKRFYQICSLKKEGK